MKPTYHVEIYWPQGKHRNIYEAVVKKSGIRTNSETFRSLRAANRWLIDQHTQWLITTLPTVPHP